MIARLSIKVPQSANAASVATITGTEDHIVGVAAGLIRAAAFRFGISPLAV